MTDILFNLVLMIFGMCVGVYCGMVVTFSHIRKKKIFVGSLGTYTFTPKEIK